MTKQDKMIAEYREFGEEATAKYIEKYGIKELVNVLYIPKKFETPDKFYEYCLSANLKAKDAGIHIYE